MAALLQNTIFGRNKNSFVSTWRTSNTSTGSSSTTQIKLPLVSTGTYNFTVDWGDGTFNIITSWNQTETTHTYSVDGDYIIKIKGTCTGWSFNNLGDKLKILSIASWGKLKLGNNGAYFNGCANLNLSSVSDILDLSGTGTFYSLFSGCTSLTTVKRINEWNTSKITNTTLAFFNCSNFNQDLSNWNTSAVISMSNMFQGASVFNQNLGSWNVSKVTNFTAMFASASSFNNGESTSINNWVINTTTSSVLMVAMFQSASSFNQPIGSWNVSKVTAMNSMFLNSTKFNQPLDTWNVSAVTNMNIMFGGSGFNQNIGSWNVSNVTNFGSMFNTTKSFNNGGSPDINNWTINTSVPVAMNSVFNGAIAFNQPIGNWNVSAVTTFNQMFLNAYTFNNGGSSDINNWTLNTVVSPDIQQMFRNATSFNQPIGNWNVSKVTNFTSMFQSALAFNQNLGSWNVTKATAFTSMFQNASAFNNGNSDTINNWTINTTENVNMQSMFQGATVFNQSIGSWNVSSVTNMNSMFFEAKAFNQPLDLWDVSKVTNMFQLFLTANSFNQSIGNWNVSNVTNFTNFMTFKTASTYSSANLDAIYNGWSSRPVQTPITISFGSAKRTSASNTGKTILTSSPNNWVITDGGI